METNLHKHSHIQKITTLNGIYVLAIVLNLLFVAVEATAGLWSGSLGLLSDAGHNLSDVFSLLLAMIAFRLSHSLSTKKFTYGYKKTSVLISLLNAVLLLVAVGAIVIESVRKFREPADVSGGIIIWTALAGIIVNGGTALMLMKQQKHDINTRGAYLHMAADTLVSAGVVISGVLISVTGSRFIDPSVSLLVATVILISTWKLLSESFRLSIDAVPESIDIDSIFSEMVSIEGVKDVHHIHIWPVSTTEIALTAHVVLESLDSLEQVRHRLKHLLYDKKIGHSTLEFETLDTACHEHNCR